MQASQRPFGCIQSLPVTSKILGSSSLSSGCSYYKIYVLQALSIAAKTCFANSLVEDSLNNEGSQEKETNMFKIK